MRKYLIVVDMQNDFIDGALSTMEAQKIIPNAVKKIESFDGEIFATLDTHFENYLETSEGRNLPVEHCIKNTDGWQFNDKIKTALEKKGFTAVEKLTFGSIELPSLIKASADDSVSIELIGLCTDICVVSNALILKASFPEAEISVDSACCAGVTPEKHKAALETMASCQIKIV
ncbi:MAG: cysteine hydrolase [Ruminococcus sp.]|nr:cysteine hydrolase [Ruminococcus sp.]